MSALKKSAKPKAGKAEVRVKKSFIFKYTAATAGLFAALLTPVVIGLSLKLIAIDPVNATTNLSLVAGVGAFLAVVANPLFGRLSDRTTSRLGMRRPWLIGGGLVGLGGLLLIAVADTVPLILVGWSIAQIALNAALAALMAVIADQVPSKQRGTVSGFIGIAQGVGVLLGVGMAQLFNGSLFWIFLAPGLLGLFFLLLFALTLKDRRLIKSQQPAYNFKALILSFWTNPFKHPDFGWAWVSRFSILLSLSFVTTYQTFYLIRHLGIAEGDVTTFVFLGTIITIAILIFGSIIGGWLSDKFHRRKRFVWMSAFICGVGLYLLATGNSIGMFFIAAGVIGLAQGAYMAVDLALVTEVLPSKKDTAKDLGVINIANALPQSVAPAIAPIFLAINGPDNFTSLFIAAGVFAAIAAVAIFPIRAVK